MKSSVYYDEIGGQLYPQWMLLPADLSDSYVHYSLNLPYERFYPEEFHDSLAVITVSQASLTKDPFNQQSYSINTEQLKADLLMNGGNLHHLEEADYFLVRFDDLEEVLQMSVRRYYSG
ncbi:hypothetical protein [Alkalihalobacillus sp. 1P02AB]|uniref:hypothetical protein n=1 Tax=Alkalihalobacillus sp. 1P02AB TaxID=3132260 RepID=UPI0039A63A74